MATEAAHPTITDISIRGIRTIPHCEHALDDPHGLERALLKVVDSPEQRSATVKAEQAFWRLSNQDPGDPSLNRFLNGWKTLHVTGLYVSGLMIRIQMEANEAAKAGDDSKAALLNRAAYHVGQIIVEDTGVVGVQHGALYERFAKAIAGDDEWKLDEHAIPACDAFRRYVEKGRLRAPIEDGILLTAASENWNTGEYTYATPVILDWLKDRHAMDKSQAATTGAYVSVHAGDTELDHFTHALKAWQLYNAAHGRESRPEKAQQIFADYAAKAGDAYAALRDSLPPPPSIKLRPALEAAADGRPPQNTMNS